MLISFDLDFAIRQWDVATGQEIRHTELNMLVDRDKAFSYLDGEKFSPDGRMLVVFKRCPKDMSRSAHAVRVQLWDVPSGRELAHVDRDIERFPNVTAAFSPDGQMLASAGLSCRRLTSAAWYKGDDDDLYDSDIRLWDTSSLQELRRWNGGNMQFDLAFSPDSISM